MIIILKKRILELEKLNNVNTILRDNLIGMDVTKLFLSILLILIKLESIAKLLLPLLYAIILCVVAVFP